jgi:hypothetical protein
MPELPHPAGIPDRPDFDQLRRLARELQRAAAAGDREARRRLRAVSSATTLTAAQLAMARELGYASWAKLKEEVERRRTAAAATPAGRWSLGGGPPLTLERGVLSAVALLVDDRRAVLEGTFVPSRDIPTGPPPAWQRLVMPVPLVPRLLGVRREPPLPQLRGLLATDDRGAVYTVRPRSASGKSRKSGRTRVLERMYVVLSVDPVPPRGVGWVELRDGAGAASRLLPARHASVAVGATGAPTPVAGSGFGDLNPLDIGAELLFPDGATVRVDCLVPGDDAWRLHMRVRPSWLRTPEEARERVPVLEVAADDDLGGAYASSSTRSRRGHDWEEVTVEFRPRLDHHARRLTVRFSPTPGKPQVRLDVWITLASPRRD